MPYYRWIDGDMEGHVVAADEDDARAQLGEEDGDFEVVQIEGPLDLFDDEDADHAISSRRDAIRAARRTGMILGPTGVTTRSHVGGRARVAADLAWPEGLPLLAEVDLGELARAAQGIDLGLPERGRLSLFFDPRGAPVEGWLPSLADRIRLIDSPDDDGPLREPPSGVEIFPEQSLVGGLERVLPAAGDVALRPLFGVDEDAYDVYVDFVDQGMRHMIRGHASWLQDDPRATGTVDQDLTLLWQIAGDDAWLGGRCEASGLFLLIRDADLGARRFSDLYVTTQALYP
jgi:hypothetical protein